MIITFPVTKSFNYMGQTIEVPLWVKYVALLPRPQKSKNASLIGFSRKPKLTENYIWKSSGRQEEIGFCDCIPRIDTIFLTLEKVE